MVWYMIEDKIDGYLTSFGEWWSEAVYLTDLQDMYNLVSNYKSLPGSSESLPATRKDVQAFISEIEDDFEGFEEFIFELDERMDCGDIPYYLGIFVSYCVNELCAAEYIELKINKPYSNLGIYNSGKSWKIKGDVGCCIGYGMTEGEITVEGDVARFKPFRAGLFNSLLWVRNKKGFLDVGEHTGGEIYHREKLVYKDGEMVGEVKSTKKKSKKGKKKHPDQS
ncbi:MAG: hypothetical protein U9P44_00415, partial [archaeon]|nr:hypothetical protein [archaeon]